MVFDRDTFAFANELVWDYQFDPVTGAAITRRNDPRPNYTHRCFVLVRSARQFLYHARFDSSLPKVDVESYRRLVRNVLARDPRRPGHAEDAIVIPGYGNLRVFSQEHETLLKANCGGAWQSYLLRSHWRIVLPMTRAHQMRMARQLVESFTLRLAPIVHLIRFPQLTINHGLVLMDCTEASSALRFTAYDPNLSETPVELWFDLAQQTFFFPRNLYWPGGRVDVIEVYRGGLY